MPSKPYCNLSDGEDNILDVERSPRLTKNNDASTTELNIPPGVTLEDHLAFSAFWGADYAQHFGQLTEEVYNTIEEPQPVEILCDPCDWIKTADEELEWLPKEETWTISPEWLCKVGYWLEALPSAEEWASVDEATPYPAFTETCEIVTLDTAGFYPFYEPTCLDIKIRKKGRTQSDYMMDTTLSLPPEDAVTSSSRL